MSHTALVKFAPIFTPERFDDPAWNRPGRTLYDRGAFRFLPGKTNVPLLVDHEDEIGTVHEVFTMDWIDGPWTVARATVTAPPSWLKSGARASFGFSAFQRRELNIRGTRADVIAGGIVREVSVLSPSVKPAEPCAEVLSLRPTDSPAAGGPTSSRPVVGEVVIHPSPSLVTRSRRPARFFTDEEIRERLARADDTGVPGAFELEIAHMKRLEQAALTGRLPLVF